MRSRRSSEEINTSGVVDKKWENGERRVKWVARIGEGV